MQILALKGKINNFFNNTKVEKKDTETNNIPLQDNITNSYDLPSSAYSNLFIGENLTFGKNKRNNRQKEDVASNIDIAKIEAILEYFEKLDPEVLKCLTPQDPALKYLASQDPMLKYLTSQDPSQEYVHSSSLQDQTSLLKKPYRGSSKLFGLLDKCVKRSEFSPLLPFWLFRMPNLFANNKDYSKSSESKGGTICTTDKAEENEQSIKNEIISKIADKEYEEAKKIAPGCKEFTENNKICVIDSLKQIQELLELDNIPEHLVRAYLFLEDADKNESNLELIGCAEDLREATDSTEQLGNSEILATMLLFRGNVLDLENKKLDKDQKELFNKIKGKFIEQFSLNFEFFLDSMGINTKDMAIEDWSRKLFLPDPKKNTVVLFSKHLINFADIKNKKGSELCDNDFDQILEALRFLKGSLLEKNYDNDTVEQKIKKQFLELIYDFCLENVEQNTCPFELHKALLQLVLDNDNEASIRSTAAEILFKNATSDNEKYINSILSKFKNSDKMYNPRFLNDTEKAILTSGISHLAETSFSIPKIATVARILDSAGLKWEDIAMDSLYSKICKSNAHDIANITNAVCTFINGRPSYYDDVAAINKYPILADVFEANLGKGNFSETLLTDKFNIILEHSKNLSNLANIDKNIYTVNNSQWSQDQKEQFDLCHSVSTLIISLLSNPKEDEKINGTFFRKLEKLFGKDEALRTLKDSFAAFFDEMNMNETNELERCFSNLPVLKNNNSLENFLENCSYQTLIDILNSANTVFEVNLMKNCIIKILKEKLDNGSIISLQDERYLNTFEQFRTMAGKKIEHGFSYSSDIPEVKEIEPLPLIQRKENLDGYDLLLLNVAEIIGTRMGYVMSIPPKELRYFDIVNDENFMTLENNECGVAVPATATWQYYAAANTKEAIDEIFNKDASDKDIRNKYLPGLKQMVLSGNDEEQNFYRRNDINMEAKQGAHRLLGHVDENGKLKFTHLCKKENGNISFYKIIYPETT